MVAAALFVASAWGLPALGLDAAQEGASPEVLIVAASDDFPPVNMLDDAGQLSGFGREMSTAVLRAVGVEPRYLHSPYWVEVLAWLESGQADLIHDVGYTPERERTLDFTEPILRMDEVIFVRRDQQDIHDLESLRSKTVACVEQHISHIYLERLGISDLRVVHTPGEALVALIAGEADAVVYPREIFLYYIQHLRSGDRVKIVGEPLRTLNWSMAVRKGDTALRDLLNRGIRAVKASGEQERIRDKWFGESVLAGYSAREVALLVVTASIVAVLLGVLVTFMVANVRLRRAKRELGRSEERSRAIVENALDIMTIVDREGRVLLESPSVERVLGYTPEERQGQDVFAAVHPDDEPRVRETLAHVLEQPDSVERVEFRVRAKDGSWTVMEALGRNLMHTAGIEGILVTSRNIASRRAAERLELRIGRILEDSMNEIFVVDPKTMRIIEVNREARENLGYSLEELRQMTPFEFVVDPPPAEFEDFLRPLFRGEADRIVRSGRHRRKDGTTYEVEARVSISRSEDPPVMIAVTADMTERLATEAQLRQAQKMEAVGRLAGGIAHDFNNLLQVILGHGELLLEHPDITPPVRNGLHHAVEAARKAAELTRQLLAFSRKQVLEPKVLDLNVVVDGIQSMVRRVIGDHIALEVRLEPDLGAALVDRGQIEQVILNLVVNACDAMPRGGKLTIETRNVFVGRTATSNESPLHAGTFVLLAVTDSGQGMTPEVCRQVFDPFFTTKELGKGTGLGLSTVLGIVEQSGGRIRVESEPGRGTRFEVYFPRVNGQIDEAVAALSGRVPSGTETLLLVEDDEAVRETVRCMLEESGYRVHAASRPDEALRIADRLGGGIDLLLTDVVMPLMSGRDLAEELGSKLPSLRVLLMSGHTDNSIVATAGDLPAGAFLQKPFTADELTRKIREVLEEER